MHAPAFPRSVPHPAITPVLRALVAIQLVVVVAAVTASGQLDGPRRPNGGAPVPGATGAPTPSVPPSLSPSLSPSPTARPSDDGDPEATRPPHPIPTVTPGTDPSRPTLPPTSGGRPPSCDYLDVPTEHDDLDDWDRTLLDTIYRLPSGYAPPDLVDTSLAGLNGGYLVRRLVVADLRAMAAAARSAGAPVQVVSGYRSYAKQAATFQHWVDVGGYAQALRTSARPGHSEHQLGTAIDVTSLGGGAPWEYADWASTEAGAWIEQHAWRYGFVVSYPRGAFDQTCYDYEPWHLRYFGRERAAAITASGLTAREVLWTLQ